MFDPSRILILAPHTDDGELGCGATIAKFASLGKEVFYAAFCLCSKSLSSKFPPNALEVECKKATSVLGVPASRLILFNYEVRELPQSRQNVLEELLKLNKDIHPEMVLLPAVSDIHQDHQVIHHEAIRAFKNITFAGYELPWNNYSFHTNFFVRISDDELDKKIASLKAYDSQSQKNYMKEDFIRSLATVRGIQANSKFAEAFEVYRWIV